MFSMRSYTRVVTFVQICQKTWPPCDFVKILIGRFSRNFFSGTAEGIELKSGVYVPMNVFNIYCLRHLKIQNGHQQRSKFALKPYGKQHFHLLLENSQTEFNQIWQRCFLRVPKNLSWFVLTRPTHRVLSLLCIGQFVMPIILTWVLSALNVQNFC